MARITVEDCLENVDNRFELVLIATKRARQLAIRNAEPLVIAGNDKPTIVALREIAAGHVDFPDNRLPDEANPIEEKTASDIASDEEGVQH